MAVSGDFVEVELRVGMLDLALAKLMTEDHHTIEFPTILLPENVEAGSIVKLQCSRALKTELADRERFEAVQQQILDSFATLLPKPPVLRARNTTQTSVVLEWDPIEIANADLHFLALYKGDQRLGLIPRPLKHTVTKVSNLEIDAPYDFHLVLSTSAGDFESETLKLKTHKMTDLTGVVVCIGSMAHSEISLEEVEETLTRLGCKPPQESVKLDTTHFICTTEGGAAFDRAAELNIPIVRPEWLKACAHERRLVSVRGYYLSANPHLYNKPSARPDEHHQAAQQPASVQPDSAQQGSAQPGSAQLGSVQPGSVQPARRSSVASTAEPPNSGDASSQPETRSAAPSQDNASSTAGEPGEPGEEKRPPSEDAGPSADDLRASSGDLREPADSAGAQEEQPSEAAPPAETETGSEPAGPRDDAPEPRDSDSAASTHERGASFERNATEAGLSPGSHDELSAAVNKVLITDMVEQIAPAADNEDKREEVPLEEAPSRGVENPDVSTERELEKELQDDPTAALKEGEEQRVIVEHSHPVEAQSADVTETAADVIAGEAAETREPPATEEVAAEAEAAPKVDSSEDPSKSASEAVSEAIPASAEVADGTSGALDGSQTRTAAEHDSTQSLDGQNAGGEPATESTPEPEPESQTSEQKTPAESKGKKNKKNKKK